MNFDDVLNISNQYINKMITSQNSPSYPGKQKSSYPPIVLLHKDTLANCDVNSTVLHSLMSTSHKSPMR